MAKGWDAMHGSTTYSAVLYGKDAVGSLAVELEYANGQYQDVVVLEAVEHGRPVIRTYRRGSVTEQPIPYRFVDEEEDEDDDDEDDTGVRPS